MTVWSMLCVWLAYLVGFVSAAWLLPRLRKNSAAPGRTCPRTPADEAHRSPTSAGDTITEFQIATRFHDAGEVI